MEKKNYRFIEVTPENESQYLDQIADLEVKVLNHMESHGQIGQLFTTGKEDISSYVHSDSNSVLVAVDDSNKVQAATYITQGQIPFTYNDITKYFKSGAEYENYVKGLYPSITYYHKAMLDAYELKMKAFKYASQKISEEYPEYKGDILQFLNHELEQEHNHFDEKSPLRDKLNAYMSSYVLEAQKTNPDAMKLYERFYWLTSKDISREFINDHIFLWYFNNIVHSLRSTFIKAKVIYSVTKDKKPIMLYIENASKNVFTCLDPNSFSTLILQIEQLEKDVFYNLTYESSIFPYIISFDSCQQWANLFFDSTYFLTPQLSKER